jgi:hypothetical protein
MAEKNKDVEAKKEAKRRSNRKSHAVSKTRQEHALLRLDLGSLAVLDSASSAAGLSRSAFASIYLVPLTAALADRMPDIDLALRTRKLTLSTFLARAIDAALAGQAEETRSTGSANDIADMLLSLCE